MFKAKIIVVFLAMVISINELSSQCIRIPKPPSNAECCLVLSAVPFVLAAYRLSTQYGLAENEQLEQGHIFGGELTWFPVQSLTEDRRHLVYALKFAFNNTGTYGPNAPYMSAFIETDYYFRSIIGDSIPKIDPYIGFDIGLTDGFLSNIKSKFGMSPIIGCNYHFSKSFSLYVNGRYSFIYENPRSEMLQFSLGIQWNLTSLIF